MKQADWYFDFISPFAYLAMSRIEVLSQLVEIRLQPILFAGLLEHWGQKGPAEIVPKRIWTYRWCTWLAAREGIPFRFPASHPFNPLPYLRLAVAAKARPMAVRSIFDALWTSGADPGDPSVLEALMRSLDVDPAEIQSDTVKSALRASTAQASALGVFGVPTLVVDDHTFWGVDGLDLAQAYLDDPGVLDTDEMKRVSDLPIGVARRF